MTGRQAEAVRHPLSQQFTKPATEKSIFFRRQTDEVGGDYKSGQIAAEREGASAFFCADGLHTGFDHLGAVRFNAGSCVDQRLRHRIDVRLVFLIRKVGKSPVGVSILF